MYSRKRAQMRGRAEVVAADATYRVILLIETGGWAFVLVKHADGWRVRNYGWAVMGIAMKARAN